MNSSPLDQIRDRLLITFADGEAMYLPLDATLPEGAVTVYQTTGANLNVRTHDGRIYTIANAQVMTLPEA